MSKVPNKPVERAAGIVAVALSLPWAFGWVLKVLDWISRAQTAALVAPYMWFFGTPAGFLSEFVVGVGLLMYATRLERNREMDETPRIIPAWGEPAKPRRRRIWIKLTGAALALSCGAAFVVFRTFERRLERATAQPPPAPQAPAAPAPEPPKKEAPKKEASRKQAAAESPGGKPADTAQPRASISPVDIPVAAVPKDQPRPGNGKFVPTAEIGGVTVRAGDKPVGTLYVRIGISQVSKYRGNFTAEDLAAAKKALESTNRIVVFTGEFKMKGRDLDVSLGGVGGNEDRSIYYFQPDLQNSCAAVQGILANALGKSMKCEAATVPKPTDAGPINVLSDFIFTSGLDMDIWL
jgi:hypothetical protein